MPLTHGMLHRNIMLIFHIFDGDTMIIIRFFRFQSRQRNAAAADQGISHAVDHIPAHGAYIELSPQHIGRNIPVGNRLSVHQFNHRNPQRLGQRLQKRNIRQSLPRLPLGYGLGADTYFPCQLRLGQFPRFPQLLNGRAGHIAVHGLTSFLQLAYHTEASGTTCAS